MAKLSKFGAAFKAAKSAGKSEFSFNGKSYNTKTKGDSAPKSTPAKKAAPTPTARPASATDGRKKLATQREVQKYGDAIREVVKAKAVKSSTTPIPAKSGTGTKPKPQAMSNVKGAAAKVASDVKSIGPSRTTSVTPKSKSENKSTGGYTGITARSGFDSSKPATATQKANAERKATAGNRPKAMEKAKAAIGSIMSSAKSPQTARSKLVSKK